MLLLTHPCWTSQNYRERLIDTFLQQWSRDLYTQENRSRNEYGGNKLRFYALLKDQFGMEQYLDILPITSRVNLTRLRLSCHSLAIEVGRHSRLYIPACSSLCQVCNQVDDEIHYLFHCTRYSTQRAEMFSTVFSNTTPPHLT